LAKIQSFKDGDNMQNNFAVLVTGGSGNIGRAVVSELCSHNYSVTVLCRSSDSEDAVKALGAKSLQGDINNTNQWISSVDEFDALIHLACGFDENMGQIDMALMHAIVKQTAHRKNPLTLLYTSGCWNYPTNLQMITEQSPKQSIPDFQWMLDAIDYLTQQPQIALKIVSPVNVVSEEEQTVPAILHWEYERTGLLCIPDTEDLHWALVERKDLAVLYRLVLEKGRVGEEYIGAADESVAVTNIAAKLANKPVKRIPIEDWQAIYGNWVLGYSLNQPFSSAKARTELNWQPKRYY